MRDSKDIQNSGQVKDDLIIEVLLDIRELLRGKPVKRPVGRPRKVSK